MLDHGSHHASRKLGTHGQRIPIQRVRERVHFLFDDVGDFANAAREQSSMFEHGCTHVAVAVTLQPMAHFGFKVFPPVRGSWQSVIHAANGGKLGEFFRHFYQDCCRDRWP